MTKIKTIRHLVYIEITGPNDAIDVYLLTAEAASKFARRHEDLAFRVMEVGAVEREVEIGEHEEFDFVDEESGILYFAEAYSKMNIKYANGSWTLFDKFGGVVADGFNRPVDAFAYGKAVTNGQAYVAFNA